MQDDLAILFGKVIHIPQLEADMDDAKTGTGCCHVYNSQHPQSPTEYSHPKE